MTHAPSRRRLRDVRTVLSSAGLIRLVSEIDDHGAIPVRAMARTLTDLSTRQIRQAIEQADALNLLARTSAGVGLSAAGRDLADLYDTTARWARRHNYPAARCDFATRIRRTFTLLGEPSADDQGVAGSDSELGRVRLLMTEWIHAHEIQRDHGTNDFAA